MRKGGIFIEIERPYKKATCAYCGEIFDRNKIPFIVVTKSIRPRYIHASCLEGYKQKIKNKKNLDTPINPAIESMCEFCHKAIPRGTEVILPGDRFSHKECNITNVPKNDKEKLEEYIQEIFNESFVDPAIQKSIANLIDKYKYTYGGIHGTLYYLRQIKHFKVEKSKFLGIVPYYYTEAKKFFEKVNKSKEVNKVINIKDYEAKRIEIKKRREKENFTTGFTKKKTIITFLDEDENGK